MRKTISGEEQLPDYSGIEEQRDESRSLMSNLHAETDERNIKFYKKGKILAFKLEK